VFERWYEERKELQSNMRNAKENAERAFWDKRQLVKKINLNSLYGAILNAGSRFFDIRIGQSVTLNGRCVTRHMAAQANEIITGEYNYKGDAIIYGDTDSVYIIASPL
jgi:DNA polymerase elongation subunit (family B)